MNILIYGFGRMGLTHYSILKGLNPDFKFCFVEPNKILRRLLCKNVDAEFLRNDSSLDDRFDITLITTPPFIHLDLLKNCINRGDDKIFIEKPFGGFTNTDYDSIYDSKKIYIGYVLRFNPCIRWVKDNIPKEEICLIRGKFLSNTLVKRPSGWRNGPFSGVLNEVGSHVIDLIQYISGIKNYEVLNVEKQSVISDIDDILSATLRAQNGLSVELYFNWVEKTVRKPLFNLEIKMENGDSYVVDQQQIRHYDLNEELIDQIGVTDLAETVPFYLRGIDFTKQMEDLLGKSNKMARLNDGLMVNKLMCNIIKNEANLG
ncbi:Gfo/Idh/MocA family oxidoreductase [Akkermansiaceae bacterium]|nr:Gfo/Idh/MocA family oxidoreductase [Akkermansiaceae bacterium]